ncbi:exodeoxyribonuclease V gamma chain [Gordonia polyisoprenivorans NBRC 16320 = JCM 10675]|uniref:RecBCD enzyme subunit RecC n=1 Tax=Gordonia polyisoprenivorans TaxID=84595 RepID=A0A846WRI3_9ACTN|nr:exodeoxyribonuclease V subunit gamma [Gordonia polyisoprenivorans]NKY04149.1 exodeoxyribonuclease V subunit gamma [Gordonia polyisoprenivorans]UZF53948.1 exodeoxyribonuclease V subunit gamma [Gordonia polyisoprenivorans]GAB21471.1 exodeoxyribonuclease V gamma chain [Gordonia polyisoprenivorans NBRC 16320 = JCM 10675]
MLRLHRAERTDVLADALADVLATGLPDPMASEIVAVPARGIERWLSQRLAVRLGSSPELGDGIAANIGFCSPGELTDAVIDALDTDAQTATAWRADALVWPVLAVLDDLVDDPQMAMLARHIGSASTATAAGAGTNTTEGDGPDGARLGRRYATARHIADLFERYARQRPGMLADWAAGGQSNGAGAALPDDMAWQPRFWRAVRERVGAAHPVERLDALCEAVRADPGAVDLPPRVSVFGPTRITETFRQVASALGAHRDVHLFVPHPGPALWRAVATTAAPADARRASWRPPSLRNPLLAGLSHDVQELQLSIAGHLDTEVHHRAGDHPPATVLQTVQAGIRDDSDPRADRGTCAADDSIEIHACHGPERQVEALRDRLLHLFDADPTLQPRDVIVMCPDVETFAPLVRGAFGQSGLDHPAAALRVRLADRGLRHLNPVLDVVATVVELAVGRITAGQVTDLLTREPVSRRFAMSDDDLDWVREWLSRSGIRWGIDETQRKRFGLSGFGQGTFSAGLDRVALGVVAEEDDGEWLGAALPLEGVESTQIDLAGRLMEFVDRLGALVVRLSGSASAADWAESLIAIVDELTETAPGDEWQTAQAHRSITEALACDTEALACDTEDPPKGERLLRLSDVRDLVAMMIAGRPTRANFRTGELTVCTLVPMRSVPHRVIVLLGVDAEAFPRALRVDGDDILGRVPLVGERNPRAEDRQLFLDALTAAQEHFLVFYTGADPVSGSRVPPAVVVSELADTVATLCGIRAAGFIRRHTLHGFDARNFEPGGVGGVQGPFSFDRGLLAGARALRGTKQPVRPIAGAHLGIPAPDADSDVELTSLVSFFANPIEGFVRQRLGARMPDEEHDDSDRLEVRVAGLEEWAIGDRLLARMLAGADLRDCQMAEVRRGTLPPAEFGRRELVRISRQVGAVYDAAVGLRHGDAATRDFVLDLPDGTRVHGSVGDVFGTGIVAATYSKVRAKHRLSAWIRLVALAAAQRCGAVGGPVIDSTTMIGRADRKAPGISVVRLAGPDDPLALLAELVAIRRLGLQTVLPLPLDPGAAYGIKRASGSSEMIALNAAATSFAGKFGAHTDPYLRLVYGADVTASVDFDTLTSVCAADTAPWAQIGLVSGEPVFTTLARRLWGPVVEHEVIR